MNFRWICGLVSFFASFQASALTSPLGLTEGLMGNSGVAASYSSASSYYNPSLLKEKQQGSFAISGTTFGSVNSESDSTKTSSLAMAPSYLSSVLVGDSVNHELFYANYFSGNVKITNELQTNSDTSKLDLTHSESSSLLGYSLAFRHFPFAMQMALNYSETSQIGFSEAHNSGTNLHTSTHLQGEQRRLELLTGVSTHIRFDNGYGFGANFRSAGFKIYQSQKNSSRSFTHDNGTYQQTEGSSFDFSSPIHGNLLSLGHSFVAGSHEFLTDSQLWEQNSGANNYKLTQSFGYRYGTSKEIHFYCGGNHAINEDIKYVGQNFYVSSGLSWMTNTLRSSFGGYFAKEREGSRDSTMYGITIASQFSY